MSTTKIKMTCPKCKKLFAIVKPEKPGTYRVACPHCQAVINLKLQPVEVKMQGTPAPQPAVPPQAPRPAAQPAPQPAAQPTSRPAAPQPVQPAKPNPVTTPEPPVTPPANTLTDLPLLGKVELTSRGKYVVKTPAVKGVKSRFACPKCGRAMVVDSKVTGKFYIKCAHCATPVAVMVNEPAPVEEAPSKKPTRKLEGDKVAERGQLTWGKLFSRKRHELRAGTTVIGRRDLELPSDLMFDDSTMSRRSVQLLVDARDGSCQLKVLSATNPVTVNGVAYPEGSSLYLTFNDTLKLGRTVIVYSKVK